MVFAGHVAKCLGSNKAVAVERAIFRIGCALEAGAICLAIMNVVGSIITGVSGGLFLSTLVIYKRNPAA